MIRWSVLAALLSAPLCVYGQGVDVPSVGKRDRPIVIGHDEGVTVSAIFARIVNDQVVWNTLPDEHFVRREKETILVAPAGEYIVTTGESEIIKVVEEGTPDPDPRPEPKPDPRPEPDPPEPEPEPVEGLVWVMVFEQTTDRADNIEFAKLMTSEYWDELDDKPDFEAVSYDIDSKDIGTRSKWLEGEELPLVVICREDGEVLGKQTVKSQADLERAIKEATGRE
jgi:hypothetical protein